MQVTFAFDIGEVAIVDRTVRGVIVGAQVKASGVLYEISWVTGTGQSGGGWFDEFRLSKAETPGEEPADGEGKPYKTLADLAAEGNRGGE